MPHVAERLILALLLAEGVLPRLVAMLATKTQQMLPIIVTAILVVVLLLQTRVAVLVIVALAAAEIVKWRLAHPSVGVVALSGTSAKLTPIIGVEVMPLQTVNHMLIMQGEYFHLGRVFRYRQSSPCWKPGWRVQGRT